MKRMWDMPRTIDLIERVKTKRLIWDPANSDYRSKELKANAIAEIAECLNLTSAEVYKKWHAILVQYRREKKLLENRNARGASHVKIPWFGYKHLKFLESVRSSSTNTSFYMMGRPINDSDMFDGSIDNSIDLDIKDELVSLDDNTKAEETAEMEGFSEHSSIQSPPTVQVPKDVMKMTNDRTLHDYHQFMTNSYNATHNKDDIKIFTEMVDHRLRRFKNPRKVCILRHQIEKLLFEAEMQDFDEVESKCPTSSSSFPMNQANLNKNIHG